jgi:hypothetical protein
MSTLHDRQQRAERAPGPQLVLWRRRDSWSRIRIALFLGALVWLLIALVLVSQP